MIDHFRKISYVLAYAVATIPLWHYIRDGRILALMIAVIGFAYVMVVLSSVQAAQPILSSGKAKTSRLRWLPNKPKYHKWWMLVRRTLKWHLLLVPPKMGLALGFVQWFHVMEIPTPYNMMINPNSAQFIFSPYFYISYHTYHGIPIPVYPQRETVLIGIAIIIVFSILEGFLIAALSQISRKRSQLIVLRLMIASCIIGIMSQYQVHYYRWPDRVEYCRHYDCRGFSNLGKMRLIRQHNARVGETIHVGFLTTNGMGILLAANIMRPVGRDTYFATQFGTYDDDASGRYVSTGWDNRLFVARQIVAGLLGLLLYGGATWVILWFVEDSEPLPSVPSPLHSQAPLWRGEAGISRAKNCPTLKLYNIHVI